MVKITARIPIETDVSTQEMWDVYKSVIKIKIKHTDRKIYRNKIIVNESYLLR